MISETTFSKKFTSFWNEILPNSKNYIRLINGGLIEALYEPFEAAERKQNTALVNVLSFDILRALCNKNVLIGEVSSPNFFNGDLFAALLDQGLNYLSKFSYGKDCNLPLSNREKEQIRQLFQMMYNRYVAGNSSIEVDPSFDGCGFINMSVSVHSKALYSN
ncbi:hypothetical protein [Oleiphilus messinensis]|uniref:hypothetical protein n=1 Tax=Oleiphilus messinensis TaxID=141451 RepID=UPI000B3B5633|nr:hypothetical protein [Oleiphilus messinensis]